VAAVWQCSSGQVPRHLVTCLPWWPLVNTPGRGTKHLHPAAPLHARAVPLSSRPRAALPDAHARPPRDVARLPSRAHEPLANTYIHNSLYAGAGKKYCTVYIACIGHSGWGCPGGAVDLDTPGQYPNHSFKHARFRSHPDRQGFSCRQLMVSSILNYCQMLNNKVQTGCYQGGTWIVSHA